MPRICSFGCKASSDNDVTMHGFPNPDKHPERFKVWVSLVGGKLETEQDYDYYRRKKVCDIHFALEHRNRFRRLNVLAIPTLHLNGAATTSNSAILRPDSGNTAQSSYSHTTSQHPSQSGNAISTESTMLRQDAIDIAQPSTSHTTLLHLFVSEIPSVTSADILKEHNYSVSTRPVTIIHKKDNSRKAYYNCTPTKILQTQVKYLRTEICRLRKKAKTFKMRLANAKKLSTDVSFQQITRNIMKPAQLFMQMQLQTSKSKKGRRYSIDEKILSLSLYKKSPKAYGLLCKYFTLPSVKAMKRLLSRIVICPGINSIVFEKIKKTMLEKDKADRVCSLIFDEMSLTPQVFYNEHKDVLEGFAMNQDKKFADHVLVFMVKGIRQNFKQPIAYYFTSSMNKYELKKIIKNVIEHASNSGLIIANTVCDQSAINVGAVTELVKDTKESYIKAGKEWRHELFAVNGHEIIPLYDAPHLIKGIRNNLLSKDLSYIVNNETKIVKWEYFQQVYAADKSYGELRLLDKLTEEHVNPAKINKMRVKSATQIFSHSVAVVTEHLTARGDLPIECRQLIDIVLLLDKVFDSLNVNTLHIPNGKIYKGPIRRNSPHHDLWQKAKVILSTVKFIQKKNTGTKVRLVEASVPSVRNLIKTIEGMEALWKTLTNRYRFDCLLTRNLNQDPVENFFGNIRSYGVRNNAPNTISFEGAYKALLLNNFNTTHSKNSNCEKDINECLQSYSFFLTEKPKLASDSSEDVNTIIFDKEIFNVSNDNDAGQKNYVCGWVLRKCMKNIIKGCAECKNSVLECNIEGNINNQFIRAKEYSNKKWLCYPNNQLESCFHTIQEITSSFLKKKFNNYNIKKNILSFIDIFVEYPFNCSAHKDSLKKYFTNIAVNLIIYSWCRTINRILSGKVTYTGEDEIKMEAQKYYDKHKHYKNKK